MKFKDLFENFPKEAEVVTTPALEEEEVIEEKQDDLDDYEIPHTLWLTHDKNNPEHVRRLKFYAKHNPSLLQDMARWN